MIELIRCAGFNRQPQLNKHRCGRPQPQMPRRQRPRRVSRSFHVTRPRVLPRRRAAPGCGIRRIAVRSIVLLTRPGIVRRNKQRNNPVKTIGLTVAVCAIPSTLLRRLRRRRSGQRSEISSRQSEVSTQVAPSKLSKIRFNGLKVQRVDATKRSVVREVGVVRSANKSAHDGVSSCTWRWITSNYGISVKYGAPLKTTDPNYLSCLMANIKASLLCYVV